MNQQAMVNQQAILMAGSQKSGPMAGGDMYCEEGSRAPSEPVRGGPPCMPGRPRPAPVNTGALLLGVVEGARALVVAGVTTVAGIPLVGADKGWIGEIEAEVGEVAEGDESVPEVV